MNVHALKKGRDATGNQKVRGGGMAYTTNARTRQTRMNAIRINGTPTPTTYSSDVWLRGMAFGALRDEINRGLMHLPSNAVPIVRIARVCTKRHTTNRGAPLLALRSSKKAALLV